MRVWCILNLFSLVCLSNFFTSNLARALPDENFDGIATALVLDFVALQVLRRGSLPVYGNALSLLLTSMKWYPLDAIV